MKKALKLALATGLLVSATALAQAETVVTETTVRHDVPADAKALHLDALDINNDGIIAPDEVGEKLFFIYDTDGNEVIDNNEFDDERVVTVTPVERESIRVVDFDGDGDADQTTYSYERFMEQSRLAMFDKDDSALSAEEFMNMGFLKADVNEDNMVDMREWKSAYEAGLSPHDDDSSRYN